jgi:phage terminase small subunit
MPRERSPIREKARELWILSNGDMKLKDIAAELGLADSQIRKWKSLDNWEAALKGNVTNQEKGNVTKQKAPAGNKGGAPPGNRNAAGNRGGTGGPERNSKAEKHGLFRKYLPNDEETRQIYDAAGKMNALDLLWENIQIKFTAIIRAQKIMWVRDQNDETKVLKRQKESSGAQSDSWEKEYELQFAWDKHGSFLQAQARAMTALTSMVRQYEEMCRLGWADEEQKLRIEKLKIEVGALKKDALPDPVVFKDDLHE